MGSRLNTDQDSHFLPVIRIRGSDSTSLSIGFALEMTMSEIKIAKPTALVACVAGIALKTFELRTRDVSRREESRELDECSAWRAQMRRHTI